MRVFVMLKHAPARAHTNGPLAMDASRVCCRIAHMGRCAFPLMSSSVCMRALWSKRMCCVPQPQTPRCGGTGGHKRPLKGEHQRLRQWGSCKLLWFQSTIGQAIQKGRAPVWAHFKRGARACDAGCAAKVHMAQACMGDRHAWGTGIQACQAGAYAVGGRFCGTRLACTRCAQAEGM